MKLLVVDDEEYTRECMARQIEWGAYGIDAVMAAVDGRDALEKIDTFKPDVVITDIKMPRMTGLELLEEIQKRNCGIETIILSGFDEFEFAQRALNLGAKYFFLKPIDPVELTNAVLMLWDKKNGVSRSHQMQTGGGRPKKTNQVIVKIKDYIQKNYRDTDLSLSRIAEEFNFSAAYLSALFKANCSQNITDYITSVRIEMACRLLMQGEETVSVIAEAVGYANPTYFYKVFKRAKGCSPKDYQEGTEGGDV